MSEEGRLDPDALLRAINREEENASKAKLRVFLGMSAGVGKTYSMLKAAHQRLKEKVDVVVGYVETHGRQETLGLLHGLPEIPRIKIEYRGTTLEEMDLDAILKRKPELVIVDELAHSNAPGSRHEKRYQDVIELLDAGIDVYTALNVQHLESRKEAVEAITGIPIRETVPDSILERASLVELVDIAPTELLKRLKEGKVYLGDKAQAAAQNFFKEDRLTALREIALRMTAERVDQDLQRWASVRQTAPWAANERLLVAISHSPYTERLIRATRRLAYSLEAPWIALHVDTGTTLNHEDQTQLTKNINLAMELNAEVIQTSDIDVVSAIRRVSRQKNVTQVIVGRPTRRWIRDLIEGGSLLDRLVREYSEIDVHVIRHDNIPGFKTPRAYEFRKIPFQAKLSAYWITFWIVIGIGFLGTLLEHLLGYRTIGFVFLLAVLLVGIFASLGPVIFAAALSAIGWNFFFIPPKYTFVIRAPEDVILCVAYFVAAVIVGFLTSRIKFHEKIIREREERTNVLYSVLQDITNSPEKAEFLVKITKRIGILLDGECGVVLKSQEGKLSFDKAKPYYAIRLNEKDQAVAEWAFQNQKPAGWSTDTITQSKGLYIPLKGQSEDVGVFVYQPHRRAKKLNMEQKNLLFSITGQLGLSLERHFLEKRFRDAERLKDSEELYQTLMNSISHEMRTPLTVILGSASALDNESILKNSVQLKQVVENLQDAGDRLNHMIQNLLDMSRLSSGILALNLQWHDFSDLIGVTLKKLTKSLSRHKITVQMPDSVPLVRMDFRLMEHAISNLVLNAAIYSPIDSEIILTLRQHHNTFFFSVEDRGNGIPEESLAKIFDRFYRVPGSPTGGTGLGLSIVKSIVELHGGTVGAENVQPHGARLKMELPLDPQPEMPKEKSEEIK